MNCKVCADCGEEKPVSDFYADLRKPDGLLGRCKPCQNTRTSASNAKRNATKRIQRERRLADHLAGGVKTCRRCGQTKPFEAFHRQKGGPDGRRTKCKTCWQEMKRKTRPAKGRKSPDERFEERISRPEGARCLLWTGGASRNFWIDGQTIDARRYALTSRGVEIPDDMKVIATCGIDLCVNWEHLTLKPKGNGLRHDTKRCSMCGKEKQLSEFTPLSAGSRGRHNYCKPCKAAHTRRRAREKPALVKRATLAKFGLSLEDYEALRIAQDGLCAICHSPGGVHGLGVDHHHETGIVRGLLCSNCNSGIGMFRDDPDWMLNAVDYLRKWNAVTGASEIAPSTVFPTEGAQDAKMPSPLAGTLS